MKFFDYGKYAEIYSLLGITNTYYLAYRDIPKILLKYIKGKNALDYGCGTGRSTRFLKNLGFNVVGIDINKKMIKEAKKSDSKGRYFVIESGNLTLFKNNTFDLILSAFTFDSIFSKEEMVKISVEMKRILKENGIIITITSSPELYFHNWASFVSNFPENKNAKSGDKVKITVRGTNLIVFDCLWTDDDYKKIFKRSGLKVVRTYKPLGKETDKFKWITETKIPPWFVYILKK